MKAGFSMNTTGRIVSILVVIAVAVLILVLKPGGSGGPADPVVETGLPKLLDLGAETCVPCKQMMPILAELAEEYKGVFTVEVINVHQHQEAAERYNVNLIPTQIWFDSEGNELFRHTGFIAKAEILSKWRELGVNIPS
jgi:thioredoxin